MSDIDKLLSEAADDAELHRDLQPPAEIQPRRRAGAGNPAVLSVRLTQAQYEQLAERAERAGRPTSAEAREIILAALGEGAEDRLGATLEQVLRRTVSPEFLAHG